MPRNTSSGVRGPNSALTEFLRNEGITENFNRRRQEVVAAETDTAEAELTPEPAPASARTRTRTRTRTSTRTRTRNTIADDDDDAEEEEDDEEITQIKEAAKRKRRAAKRRNSPSESSDSDFDLSDEDALANGSKFKKFGEEDECVDCESTFLITVYSRYDKDRKGYLCETCNEELKKRERNARRNQLNARKKRKKMALALLDKTEIKVPSLQDICIKRITQNIEDVDILGDIGQANLNKISKILSRNRSLNNSTISLFLNPGLKSLEFWDCSNVDSDSLNKIALYCPGLESLTLFMCGHLHNDNLKYYSTNLCNLKELLLNGPFLISDVMWQDYFESPGTNLSLFEIRNTHRFGNDSLICLLENFGKELTLLKLSRLDGLNSAAIYDLIPHYLETNSLTSLELSYPTAEDLITDELLINILSVTGETITNLNVDGCINLTDKFLLEGVCKFCPNLTSLSMKLVDLVTNEGFAKAFNEYKEVNSSGLTEVALTKCTSLGDEAIYSLLSHSSHTLLELNLNSIHNITRHFWLQIFTDDYDASKKALKEAVEQEELQLQNNENADEDEEVSQKAQKYFAEIKFPLLTTLDVGFVRSVDNEILELIGEKCSKLKILEVYGNNKCTSRATIREGLLVIGRQSDCI